MLVVDVIGAMMMTAYGEWTMVIGFTFADRNSLDTAFFSLKLLGRGGVIVMRTLSPTFITCD